MPAYTGNNPAELLSVMHGDTDTSFFITGYKAKITSLIASGDATEVEYLKNHLGREYFRRLYEMEQTAYITDPYDAGFRPTTITGLYA
tara:strand:- start:285 stop:548 length:264 start_codon:yes stop_codon:yes gene_type:complete